MQNLVLVLLIRSAVSAEHVDTIFMSVFALHFTIIFCLLYFLRISTSVLLGVHYLYLLASRFLSPELLMLRSRSGHHSF